MHTLRRNRQTIHYKVYSGKTPVVDSNGFKTGEYTLSYGDLAEERMYISASRGTADNEAFGVNLNYERVAITDNLDCPITEETIVWVDNSTSDPHDFIVVKVAKSFNHISYALQEVDVR